MDTNRMKILAKIKKLMAMTGSPEPAEAATALRMMQKLMAQHGLTEADVATAEFAATKLKSKTSVTKLKVWELALVRLLTRAFGCDVMWIDGNSTLRIMASYVLIGPIGQLELCRHGLIVLQRQLLSARAKYARTLDARIMGRSRVTMQADSFALGWVMAVEKMVHEFARTPAYDKAMELYKQKLGGKGEEKALVKPKFDVNAAVAGFDEGSTVSLARPMTGKQTEALT